MNDPEFVGPVYCIGCGKELKNLMPEDSNYDMISGGSIGHISAPFGSRYDGDIFQVAVCDDCVDRFEKEKKIRIVGNHLFLDRDSTLKVQQD